ncbi:MAG TPA: polysaccharide deacetylase family protein [Kofleriaceae bacterium]
MRFVVVLVIALAGACRTPLDELDGAFYAWDQRTVHCAVEIDDVAGFTLEQIFAGMDRVRDSGEVLELLVHTPGVSMTMDHLEAVLAGARDRGLPFLTITEVLHGTPRAGISLQYDDWHTKEWVDSMPLLDQYGAHVTLFVGRYPGMPPTAHLQLAALAAAGHDIEAHSITHSRGPGYVEEHGLTTYLDEEVMPSLDLLRGDGYEVLSYAYPFGVRTEQTDHAILGRGVEMVRALAKPNELRANPCPY